MTDVMQQLRGQLVVSCQAWPNDPMDDTETLKRVALAALLGGGGGLRLNGVSHVQALRAETRVPIIAIEKSYAGGRLRITPDFAAAAALAAAGADIVALDCTEREHTQGEPWREIVRRMRAELKVLVMADIATVDEGIAAGEAGVDLIGTTLRGYTEATAGQKGFSAEMVRELAARTGKPVVAEGHIATPEDARRALEAGAWCVVVGSAITRPGDITAGFVRGMKGELASFDSALRAPLRMTESLAAHVIGVDIGGTAVKAAIVSRGGEITAQAKVATSAAGGRDVIAQSMMQAIAEVMDAARVAGVTPAAIGIASAGAIDSANGVVFAATENLPGWAGFDIRGFVQERFHLPVFVENDAHAAVLAELHFGAGKGMKNFAAVTLGTGVGGGVVMEGRLQRGAFGFAGTVGHHTLRFDGQPCNCGRRGCLEAYVSTAALVREYEERADALSGDDAAKAMEIARRADAGEGAALEAYSAIAAYLAEGVANVCNILDPEVIILSGGLLEGRPGLIEDVQARAKELLHFGVKRPPKLVRSAAGQYAGVQGAAASAFEGLA